MENPMDDREKDFIKRRTRRMSEWKGSLAHEFPTGAALAGTSSPGKNLAALEELRRMVYPGMEHARMDKSIERLSGG
jgi:hypothetical protein